jgi:hypothetical protein
MAKDNGEEEEETLAEVSQREQREAAFCEAIDVLAKQSDHFIIICRVGNGRYFRHVNGNSHAERFSLATGAAVHLVSLISDLAVCAAERADLDDMEGQNR